MHNTHAHTHTRAHIYNYDKTSLLKGYTPNSLEFFQKNRSPTKPSLIILDMKKRRNIKRISPFKMTILNLK